jgi:hypothetical protein
MGPNIGRKKITSTTNSVRDENAFQGNAQIQSLMRLPYKRAHISTNIISLQDIAEIQAGEIIWIFFFTTIT